MAGCTLVLEDDLPVEVGLRLTVEAGRLVEDKIVVEKLTHMNGLLLVRKDCNLMRTGFLERT